MHSWLALLEWHRPAWATGHVIAQLCWVGHPLPAHLLKLVEVLKAVVTGTPLVVGEVRLVGELRTRHLDLLTVDDDNVGPHVHGRRVRWRVLAPAPKHEHKCKAEPQRHQGGTECETETWHRVS